MERHDPDKPTLLPRLLNGYPELETMMEMADRPKN